MLIKTVAKSPFSLFSGSVCEVGPLLSQMFGNTQQPSGPRFA